MSTNAEKIWNYFKNKGLSDYGIAGLMGNLEAESGLNPTNLQGVYEKSLKFTDDSYTKAVDDGTYKNFVNDSAGYGLAQWTYWSRKQNLLDFVKKRKKSIGDFDTQLDFLYKELTESYKSVWNTLKSATSILEASNVVLMKFEKPENQGISVQQKRAKYGQEYYDEFCKGGKLMEIKVAIDAGHGSDTAGKQIPDGYKEHWINVRCASYCEQALNRCGIKTIRVAWDDTNAKDDEDVSLSSRQSQIKKAKCDASVSFHANAYKNYYNSANGIETFIYKDADSVGDSKRLATLVQNYLVQGTKQSNRGVKSENFAMCNCSATGTKASILVEIGFMTNKTEAELMKTEAFCKEQAEEVAHGICDYFGVTYKKDFTTTTTTPTPTVSSKEEYEITPLSGIVKVTYKGSDGLNVREEPSLKGRINQIVHGGTFTVVGISKDKNWYKLKSGLYLTADTDYVKFTKSSQTTSTISTKGYLVKINTTELNVRQGPGMSYKIATTVRKNQIFTIVEEKNGWGKLKSGAGWISLSYTKKV